MNDQNQAVEKVEATLESFGFEAGKTYMVEGRSINGKEILKGRLVVLTKPSKNGSVLGHLLHTKTGQLQKTEISLPITCIKEYIAPVAVAPEVPAEVNGSEATAV